MSDAITIHGSCHCGDITFQAEANPARVVICHCTDCQTFSGSAFRTSVLVRSKDFRLLEGRPATYDKTAQSGTVRRLVFCDRCGTHIYGTTPNAEAATYSLRVGVLSQRAKLPPFAQVWCQSEVSWLSQLTNIRRIQRQ